MKIENNGYDLHVLICTNEKSKGESCGPQGAQSIVDELKTWSKQAVLKGKVRINKSGCLGKCEEGIACVAYPKGDWVLNAKPSDLEEIKTWILSHDGK